MADAYLLSGVRTPIGKFRYLMWDVQATNAQKTESTCYAEFDVVVADAPSPTRLATAKTQSGKTFSGPARFEASSRRFSANLVASRIKRVCAAVTPLASN